MPLTRRELVSAGTLGALAGRLEGASATDDSRARFGQSVALSGPLGGLGREMRDGLLAAFDGANRKGGVHGRRLELVTLDDAFDPARTLANTRQLIEVERVFSLAFYAGTGHIQGAAQVFRSAGVPMVGALSGAMSLRRPVDPMLFHLRASYADEAEAIVNQLTTLGVDRIGVFHQADGLGREAHASAAAALAKRGLKYAFEASVPPGEVKVTEHAETALSSNAQVALVFTTLQSAVPFIEAIVRAKVGMRCMALSATSADALAARLGDAARDVGISQVVPHPKRLASPLVRRYQEALGRFASGAKYSYFSLEGFVVGSVIVEALNRVGRDLNLPRFTNALESIRDFDLGGMRINFGSGQRDGSKYVDLTVVGQGGEILR